MRSIRPDRNDGVVGSLSAMAALQLPVRLRGIQLGRPVDLLLETDTWHTLGFVVRFRPGQADHVREQHLRELMPQRQPLGKLPALSR